MTHIDSLHYEDPLAAVWLACARDCGITIEPGSASECSARRVLLALCQPLVLGPNGLRLADWGLEHVPSRELVIEHACQRLLAALADRHGLRGLFTMPEAQRAYWDALPIDPLGPGDDAAIPLARAAFTRARSGAWSKPIERALGATAAMAAEVRAACSDASSLWARTLPMHRAGFPIDATRTPAGTSCGTCAWSFRSRGKLRCRKTRPFMHAFGAIVEPEDAACVRYEAPLSGDSCASCGACCREGFDRVEVRVRDLVRKKHPELVSHDGFGAHLARPGGRCVALTQVDEGFRCRVYADRPTACADFELAGDACLEARRRTGLSA